MATNQFKPFASRPDANVTPQNEWENLPALLSGFAGGKASSAQVNKALRQTSFIAAALAQFVSDKSGQDVLDDGDIAAFLAKLTTGFGNQYLSRQNPFADIKADGAAAVSSALANLGLGAFISSPSTNPSNFTQVNSPDGKLYLFIANNNNWGAQKEDGTPIPLSVERGGTGSGTASDARVKLGLGDSATKNVGKTAGTVAAGDDTRLTSLKSAANRDIGTGANQIPDMSAYTSGPGWVKFPDGTILQRGSGATSISGNTTINLPIAFASDYTITGVCVDPNVANILAISKLNNSQFQAKTFAEGVVATIVHFIAWGK